MRRERDFYPTPAWATEELLRREHLNGAVLEACVGDFAMARVLSTSRFCRVWTNDINPEWPSDFHRDAKEPSLYQDVKPHWVVTNPPFSEAFQILKQAHAHAQVGVAFLLRLSFLEPTKGTKNDKSKARAGWLGENPPSDLIVLPRISFTGDGNTDSVTCAWMIWRKGKRGTISVAPAREA